MLKFSLSLFPLFCALSATLCPASDSWPQFRGPTGEGTSDATDLPLTWSETNHIQWKTLIPGEGWSSPVIQGDQIWMQTALDEGKSLRAICVDRNSGKIRQDVEIFYISSPERKHAFNSFASPTPVIENDRVYISYGMYGIACVQGSTAKILWQNTELKHDHDKNGPGSSPILYKDLLILNCDGTEERFVAAIHKQTGKTAWRSNRSNIINKAGEFKKAYQTPLVISVNGRDQLVSMGAYRVSGYEAGTGKEIWWVDIPGFSNVPRPVFANGLVYISTGFGKPELWAIRPDGYGDVTKTHVAWKALRQVPAKPSPLAVGEHLYMLADNGIISCLDGKTGREIWSERIPGAYSASPLFANGRIYCFNEQGQTVVLRSGPKPEIIATNTLASGFMSSPAVSGNALFLRTKQHLYRIEN